MAFDFVQNILSRLFGSDEEENDPQLPVSERLVRSDHYVEQYQLWCESADPSRLRGVLRRMYDLTREGSSSHLGFRIYQTPQAEGFYADRGVGFREEEFSFLIDYFRDVALEHGYRLYMSDRRHREVESGVEMVDRHFLKPDHTKGRTVKSDPIFGNITLETVALNNRVEYLKVMVTRHSGKHFSKTESFEDLVDLLLGK